MTSHDTPGQLFDESELGGSGTVVAVRVTLPLDGPFHYRVIAQENGRVPTPGDVVSVPFGPRDVTGVIWSVGDTPDIALSKIKEINNFLDAPPLPEVSRNFVQWVAAYTLSPVGAVLKMTLSVPDALRPPAPIQVFEVGDPPSDLRMTDARARVMDVVGHAPPLTAADLAREAGVGPSVVRGLAKAGALRPVSLSVEPPIEAPDPEHPGPTLSDQQSVAASALCNCVRAHQFSTSLLDGVTGSGKTEVYFEAVAQTLRSGRQVLVLLPEIALGAQWLARFEARFGTPPVQWHSDLGTATRKKNWRAIASGRASVVVGARSALFLPFPNLGLIVVDEEHDQSFKQDEGVVYNGRDMAVVRARLGGVTAILASATPSLETVRNVEAGRYQRQHLPSRHGGASLPKVQLIDMRTTKPERGTWLAPPLREAMAQTFAERGQVMLYLNRRGYAPLTLCRACGHRMQCPRCTAWLVEHKAFKRLQCHHCGFAVRPPTACPSCETEDSLVPCGPGVERLAEEVADLFPEIRTVMATSDTVTGPTAATELVRAIEEHQVDLIIGTQIVAKGYHFPLLRLVGVVDGDLGLSGGDLRAAERTYQVLTQVAGRAGRGDAPGRVLIQSFMPDHPVMKALETGERDQFLAAESKSRELAGMPPFGRLVGIVVSGRDEAQVDDAARGLAATAPSGPDTLVLGPAPAPMALLRGKHRRRLLMKAGRGVNVQALVRQWLVAARPRVAGAVRVQVDVDPYNFL